MKKQKGIAGLVVLAIIVGSFAVGLVFKHSIDAINHPVEQVVEKVLADHGIDIDFSADKIKDRAKARAK